MAKALAGLKKTPVKDGPNSQGLSEQTRTVGGKVAAEGLRKPSPNLYQEVKIDELSNDSPSFSSPAESKVIEPTPRRYELPKPAEVLSSQTLDIIKRAFNSIKWNQLPTRIKETRSDEKWKCKSVCHFGKTKTKAGCSICDTIHSYMIGNGIDKTIEQINELKKKQESTKEKLTSNRRNTFEE